jgi:hypothetical protein
MKAKVQVDTVVLFADVEKYGRWDVKSVVANRVGSTFKDMPL